MLGRIVVHDRIQVEAEVLPRYFNHSSFASLRRQLNYFSFVRLGKGRQRESTYVNADVVDLDDILSLKRRSAGGSDDKEAIERLKEELQSSFDAYQSKSKPLRRSSKRKRSSKSLRQKKTTRLAHTSASLVQSQCVSEDEQPAVNDESLEAVCANLENRHDLDVLDAAAVVLSLRSNC